MEEKRFKPNECVIKQSDIGDCMYLIEEGELECRKTYQNNKEVYLKTLVSGEAFGELCLL